MLIQTRVNLSYTSDMIADPNFCNCIDWYAHADTPKPAMEVSETRDLFNARLSRMASDMETAGANSNSLSLLAAVVGEIGNNCFDHNLGQWKDQPGCWLGFGVSSGMTRIWIADRGQGIRASLARVLPELRDDQEALEIAFRKVVSARAPERRGNGLKFVRSVINGSSGKAIYCVSGGGRIGFGRMFESLAAAVDSQKTQAADGVLSILEWTLA